MNRIIDFATGFCSAATLKKGSSKKQQETDRKKPFFFHLNGL